MPSFDIVSKVDMAELDNALVQAKKECDGRYDFKGLKVEIEKQPDNAFQLKAPSDEKLTAVREIVMNKLSKRGISLRNLEVGKSEASGHQAFKQVLKVKQGVAIEKAKKLVALVKESKIKVQASIQGETVRVTGKNRDDLQEAMALIRTKKDELDLELQFENFRD